MLIGRRVALKILPVPVDARETNELLREARAAGRIQSGHVVSLFRIHPPGEHKLWALEMEFVDGGSLSDWLENHTDPAPEVVADITRQIASGLADAHAAGVVHGDLKPGNVLMDREGNIKLTDFGLARLVGEGSHSTASHSGTVFGTPRYIAPEVLLGDRPRTASDIWSFGIVAHLLLSGRHPFQVQHFGALFHAVTTQDPDPLPESVGLPFSDLHRFCLQRHPDDRLADGQALLKSALFRGTEAPKPGAAATQRKKVEYFIVGREAERERLGALLDPNADVRAATISGETGMGKSHLLTWFVAAARQRGAICVEAVASPLDGLLRPLLTAASRHGFPSGDDPAGTRAMESARGILDDEPSLQVLDRPRALWALDHVFTELHRRGPVVIAIDDAGTLEDEDIDSLRHIARHLAVGGGAIVAAGEAGAFLSAMEDALRVELGELSREESYELLRKSWGESTLGHEDARRILDSAGGNPLVTVELARQSDETGEHTGALSASSGLADLVAQRLHRLDAADRELLDVAAVDGVLCDADALSAILELTPLGVLRSLQRISRVAGIVRSTPEGFQFANGVYRDVLYNALSPDLRRVLHRSLAEKLQETDDRTISPERVGLHWAEAGHNDLARPYLLRASDAANKRHDYARCLTYAARAGLSVDTPPDDQEALRCFDVIVGLAASSQNRGRPEDALRWLSVIHDAAQRSGQEELRLRAAVRQSSIGYFSRGVAAVDEQTLITATTSLPLCNELGMAHYVLGVVSKYQGDLERAEASMREADRVYLEVGSDSLHSASLDQLASIALRSGNTDEAAELYGNAAAAARAAGQPASAAVSELNGEMLALEGGRFDGLESRLREGIRTLRLEGVRNLAGHAQVVLARLFHACGQPREAEQTLAGVLEDLRSANYLPGLMVGLADQAYYLGIRGEQPSANQALDEARSLARDGQNRSVSQLCAAYGIQLGLWTEDDDAVSANVERWDANGVGSTSGMDGIDTPMIVAESVLYGLDPVIAKSMLSEYPIDEVIVDAFGTIARREAAEEVCARAHTALQVVHRGLRRTCLDTILCLLAERGGLEAGPARSVELARTLGHVALESICARG